MRLQAIETRYKGYRFRSRLEAKWAMFFETLRRPWEYEKEGFSLPSGPYLPDFWLPIEHPKYPDAGYWFEIKPTTPTPLEGRLCAELACATKHTVRMIVGPPNEGRFYVLAWHHKHGPDQMPCQYPNDEYTWGGLAYVAVNSPGEEIWYNSGLRKLALLQAGGARFEHGERG